MKKKSLKGIIFFMLSCCIAGIFAGCGNKYESSSLEDRDYVITMSVSREESDYTFSFEIADLTEYSGNSEKSLKTENYSCVSEDLEKALHMYCDETERQLDVGHVSEIVIYDDEQQCAYDIAREISNMPMMAKSVPVKLVDGESSRQLILRELIKEAYAGEDF